MRFQLPTSSLQHRTGGRPLAELLRFRRWTSKFGSLAEGWRGRWGGLALSWMASVPCLGQATNLSSAHLPPAHLDLPSAEFSLLRVMGALVLVVALFLLGIWCYRHWQRLTLYRGRTPKLSILEVRPLGNRTALYVVAYERERLLLASSPGGTQLLTQLPREDEPAAVPSQPHFATTLDEALQPTGSLLG